MKNETDIVTAANSKIMNAVETEKLFAAADNDPAINFKEGKPDQLKTATALHQPLPKKRLKQKK